MNYSVQRLLCLFLIFKTTTTIASDKHSTPEEVFENPWIAWDQKLYDEVDQERLERQKYVHEVLWPIFRLYKQEQRLQNELISALCDSPTLSHSSSHDSLSSLDTTDNESISSPNQHKSIGKQPFATWHGLATCKPDPISHSYSLRKKVKNSDS